MAIRVVVVAAIGVTLFAQWAVAGDYDSCMSGADKAYQACMKQATAANFVNDIELQDAKQACQNAYSTVQQTCDEAEVNRGGRGPDPDDAQ